MMRELENPETVAMRTIYWTTPCWTHHSMMTSLRLVNAEIGCSSDRKLGAQLPLAEAVGSGDADA